MNRLTGVISRETEDGVSVEGKDHIGRWIQDIQNVLNFMEALQKYKRSQKSMNSMVERIWKKMAISDGERRMVTNSMMNEGRRQQAMFVQPCCSGEEEARRITFETLSGLVARARDPVVRESYWKKLVELAEPDGLWTFEGLCRSLSELVQEIQTQG
jgi:hypothetical protein